MTFSGFEAKDFDTFTIEGLDERMEAIQKRIQPKFKQISEEIISDLEEAVGQDMYLHIARHARRTINPPKDTWSAYAHNKRGYKKHPHFQVGLWHDHVFVWLAYIYELPHKSEIAKKFLDEIDDIKSTIPVDYQVSLDHMENKAESLKHINLEKALQRFQNVKKGEFLIGRQFKADDPILRDGKVFIQEVKDIIQTLAPLYKSSLL